MKQEIFKKYLFCVKFFLFYCVIYLLFTKQYFKIYVMYLIQQVT